MAWLARSIANSLKLDDDDDEDDEKQRAKATPGEDSGEDQPSFPSQSESQSHSPRGVKEDLSELTKTLRSQFWGVASFLAPPPASSDHPEPNHVEENRTSLNREEEEEEDLIAGIRNDFAEIGGRFKTGISKISGNIAVSDFTKIASNFLQLGSEEAVTKEFNVGNVVGVSEEVVTFARDIAMHPKTWLDFPLPDDDDNSDDFEMTDEQQEHALAIERLAPALSALRIELCPTYITEGCFWKIYFVLLHPKLTKHDALLLSTPQVLEARAVLSHELQKGTMGTDQIEPVPIKAITEEPTHFTEKHPVESKEIAIVDKSVVDERPMNHDKPPNRSPNGSTGIIEDDTDDWLKEEEYTSGTMSVGGTTVPLGHDDEDVSFSDLEEDEEGDVPVTYKKVASGSDSLAKDGAAASGQEREKKESNEWLDVDDINVM